MAVASSGNTLHTFVDASMIALTYDGRACWSQSPTDAASISRDLGVGQHMIPPSERVISARRGGHGYLIETQSPSTAGPSQRTIWDIDGDTMLIRSRTTSTRYGESRMTVTRTLSSPPQLLRPDVICNS